MKFHRAKMNGVFMERSISENDIWQIGVRPDVCGYSVGFCLFSERYPKITYFCGQDSDLANDLLKAIGTILSHYPESVTMDFLQTIFPTNVLRNMGDRTSIGRLIALADDYAELPQGQAS